MNPDKREPVDAYLKRIFGGDTIQPGRETRILEDRTIAGQVAKVLASEPVDGVHAPITHAVPTSLAPAKYIIHVWTHKCSICQTEHKHSEVYALNHLRPQWGKGTWVRNMTPVSRLEWQVPIEVIPVTTRTTAGCFECLDALRSEILPSLPLPPVPEAVAGGPSGPARPEKGTEKGTEGTPRSKRPTTTDDFLL